MKRKFALILVAVLVPGGFLALFGAMVLRVVVRSERGRRVIEAAKSRVPAIAAPLDRSKAAA